MPASTVQQYRHVLRQRNALLKRREEGQSDLARALEPWTAALATAGAAMNARDDWRCSKACRTSAGESYKAISGEDKELDSNTWRLRGFARDRGKHRRIDGAALDRSAAAEERRPGLLLVGPHRDDVEIRLGGRKARFAASQGEQRTIAFCLRVAQKRYLRERTGKAPVLLLDDVLSELDETRRAKVLEQVGVESQAIITTTELPGSIEGPGDRVFVVEKGIVTVALSRRAWEA